MSVQSAPYYWLVCDDCGHKSSEEGDEYAAWSEVEHAREWVTNIDSNWFCSDEHDWCGDCREKHVCSEREKVTDDLSSLEDDGYWPVCPECKEANR